MSDFLAAMARSSAARATAARQNESEGALRTRALERPDPPELQLHPLRFDVIAEVKRRAPSTGSLTTDEGTDLSYIARQTDAYVRGGAAAVSVLTEPEEFRGTLDDLAAAARAVPVPVMRKDFIVDPYQILEARAAGAGGVLLILRILDDARLAELLDAASDTKLFVLLEAFDEDDLARAAEAVPAATGRQIQVLVGLNARDLVTLQVDRVRLARLAHAFPAGAPRVAESGIESPDDIRQAAALGCHLALVGSALMKASEPTKLTAAMIQAGRIEARNWCAPG